jgi:hypothetical protein
MELQESAATSGAPARIGCPTNNAAHIARNPVKQPRIAAGIPLGAPCATKEARVMKTTAAKPGGAGL